MHIFRDHANEEVGRSMLSFSNKIFISHTEGHQKEAEDIARSLLGRGYRVFLDKHDLPPGREYEARIEREIRQSTGMVFLVSPRSVSPRRYTLTELKLAEKKWPHAKGAVFPVMVEDTDHDAIPSYLKSVTIYKPRGNIAAEVGHEVANMISPRNWKKIAAAVAVVLVGGFVAYKALTPPPTPPYYQPQTYPTSVTYIASARCSRTGTLGMGYGSTESEAKSNAVEDCIDHGGIRGCCEIVSVRQQ
jgi:hypothetical protein